jgi:hypothetical protein
MAAISSGNFREQKSSLLHVIAVALRLLLRDLEKGFLNNGA